MNKYNLFIPLTHFSRKSLLLKVHSWPWRAFMDISAKFCRITLLHSERILVVKGLWNFAVKIINEQDSQYLTERMCYLRSWVMCFPLQEKYLYLLKEVEIHRFEEETSTFWKLWRNLGPPESFYLTKKRSDFSTDVQQFNLWFQTNHRSLSAIICRWSPT